MILHMNRNLKNCLPTPVSFALCDCSLAANPGTTQSRDYVVKVSSSPGTRTFLNVVHS